MKKSLFKIKLLLCSLVGYLFIQVHAQNLHFSQYNNAPLLINPANTGFNPDYDFRIGVNARNQWAGIMSNPYKTNSFWADAQLLTNKLDNGWLGLGTALFTDAAGSANLKATKAYLTLAYHQMLGSSSLLSIGFSAGSVSKSIDAAKLVFDNQWNGKFFDINQNPNEPFVTNRVSYTDLSWGVNYAYFASDELYANAGFSVLHFNNPKESFYASNSFYDQKVPTRYNFFVNASYKLNDLWLLNPALYVSNSLQANELLLGCTARRKIDDDGVHQLIGGLNWRLGDAIVPMIGYQLQGFQCTVTYDVTTSPLNTSGITRAGAYELSLVKNGLYRQGKSVKCPTLKF